ncbi:MAG: glycosyltransferase family 9 protein [Deltaproteobacteria bacterium]|nr:glycosyltransferase family 9 protein [Deltaproteobacteria bacterium]
MDVRFMQRVDYWVGVPLTAVVSVFDRLVRWLRPSPRSTPRRVLLIELSEMGSAMLAYSSIVNLQSRLSPESVYFLIFRSNRESVSLLNVIPDEQILTLDDRSFLRLVVSTLRFLVLSRKLKLDTAIDLELFSRFTALLSYLCGARTRVGFSNFTDEGLYRGSLLTHRVMYNGSQHMSLNFLSLTMSVFQSPVGAEDEPLLKEDVRPYVRNLPRRTSTESERAFAQQTLAPIFTVQPGARIVFFNPDPGQLALRGWPVEEYTELASLLCLRFPDVVVATVGLAASGTFAERIGATLDPQRYFDLTGSTSNIAELLSLFEQGSALVTSDSGPPHLAALVGIPTFVLFGPETPLRYAPLGDHVRVFYASLACSPCYSAANHRHSPCSNNRCMKVIPALSVFESLERLLAGESAGEVHSEIAPHG